MNDEVGENLSSERIIIFGIWMMVVLVLCDKPSVIA